MKNYKLIFHGKVEGGKFRPEDEAGYELAPLSLEGKRVTITIGRYRKPRSNEENRYYWGVVCQMIAEEMGEDAEYIHELLKSLLLKEIIYKEINGKMMRFERIKSTAELSTFEFEEYAEAARRWAATELQIVIPEPQKITI